MKHSAVVLITMGLGVAGLSGTAEASTPHVWVNGFVAVGNTCQGTFTRNPVILYDVNNINIKIGGLIGMAPPDPGYWAIHSPTSVMPYGNTGVHVVDYLNGWEYDESNTVFHNGPFVSGTWTVELMNNAGVPCSDYDNRVLVTFTLTP